MALLNQRAWDETTIKREFERLEEHRIQDEYRRWRGPEMATLVGTGLAANIVNGRFTSALHTNGNSNNIYFDPVKIPSLWVNGNIELKLYYTVNGTSAGDARPQWVCAVVQEGETASGTDVNNTDTVTVPTTAEEVATHTFSSTCPIESGDILMGNRLVLNSTLGAWTNTDDFRVLGIELIYVPTVE